MRHTATLRHIVFGYLLLILPTLTRAQSANWTAIAPAAFPTNVSGQIHGISRCSQMKFHATNANKMYAVSARGGLFISTNGGANWSVTPGTDFMSSMRFASVCVDFVNDSIIYLGTGDHNYYYTGNGVYKSTNGGLTFSPSGLSGRLVVEMVMDPTNRNVLVAATDAGIYKTTNGGGSWTLKSTARSFDDLKLKTPTSRTLYAATNDSAFFRSTNFGDTWTQITSGIVLPAGITNGDGCRVAVTPADTNVVYLGMVANGGLLYKSTNSGSTFTSVKTSASPYLTYYDNASTSSGQGDYNFSIGVDRLNANTVYVVSHNNWKSTNGGITWTQLTNWWEKCHTDMHQIVTSPYNNNNLYNVNDGGIFLSTDGGNNWTPKSDGMYGYEIYHGNCSPTRKDMISIGTQDNGELYSTSTGWFTNRGGDWGSQCAFDFRSNSSVVYYFENNQRRSVTGSDASYNLPVSSLQDIAFHRSNHNLAFAANNNIYRCTNLTATSPTWTQISTFSKTIKAVHAAFGDPNRLYVITDDASLYVTTNALSASPTWTSYTIPNSTGNAASITSMKNNPQIVYITANTGVYRSANGGASWTNIRYNLPSVNHVRILADEYGSANELVLIASGNAVYYKTANGASWSLYNQLLPSRTEIVDMSIFNDSTANTILRVATYGRGMWESPINNLRTLNANFTASNTNPCTGQAISFTDLSTGTVTSRNWSFPGGVPATSTAANPVVTYNATGIYNVTLVVSNSGGTSTKTQTAFINTNGATLPLAEGFEGTDDPPFGWVNQANAANGFAWTKTTAASGFGASANAMLFDNYNLNAPGQINELIVKRLSLKGYNSARLTFNLAYQVFSGYSDTLQVLVSTDCGASYTPVYTKGGTILSTAGSGGNNFVPTTTQWRIDTVNLSSFVNNDVLIKFRNINGYGNKLYLDNINVNATVAAVAGTNKTICAGTTTSLGAAPVSGVNYAWTPTTGLSNAAIANPTASPSTTTTYLLTATHALSGISKTDSVKITVVQPPVVVAGSYPPQCTNNPTLLLVGTPTGGAFSGSGVTGSTFNPAAATIGANTITYTVISGVCTASAQTVVTVTQPPITSAGVYPAQCLNGATITLSGSPAGGSFSGPGVSGNTFNPTAAGLGNKTITYTYSANGCTTTGQTTIAVNSCCTTIPPKPGTVTQAGGAVKVCPGETRTFSVVQQTGVTSYTWVAPAGTSILSGQGTNQIILSFNTALPTTCTLQVKSNNICNNSSAFTTKTIYRANAPSTPSVISGATYGVCGSGSQPYSVSALAGINYTWSFNTTTASITSGQGTNAVTAAFQPAFATGILSVNASNGCGTSANRTLTINAKPATPSSITGVATFCPTQTNSYSTIPVTGATSYTWTAPTGSVIAAGSNSATNSLTTAATSVNITFGTVAGSVRVKANNTCGSSSLASLAVTQNCAARTAPVEPSSLSSSLTIAPNPATDILHLSYTATIANPGQLTIHDATGKTVHMMNVKLVVGINSWEVPITSLAPGRYTVAIVMGNERLLGQFIKD